MECNGRKFSEKAFENRWMDASVSWLLCKGTEEILGNPQSSGRGSNMKQNCYSLECDAVSVRQT
jgi:hypothetical protein